MAGVAQAMLDGEGKGLPLHLRLRDLLLAIAGEPERVSPRPRPDQGDRLGRARRTPAVVERSAKTAET